MLNGCATSLCIMELEALNMAAGQHCRCAQPMLTPTWVVTKSALAILEPTPAHASSVALNSCLFSGLLRYLYAVAVRRLFASEGASLICIRTTRD
jgi:hypothetical protein